MKRIKDTFIKVIRTEYYYISKEDSINGWNNKEVIEDWFIDIPLNRNHATRDHFKIGGSDRLLKAEVVSLKQYKKDKEIK